jgi:hypothetical protein
MVWKPFVALALASITLPALAQETTVRVHLGYGFSNRYTLRNGETATTNGPVLGISFPVAVYRGVQLSFEPSFFGGGRLSSGSDKDADVYRFLVTGRFQLPGNLVGIAGLGYAHTFDRANQVNAESGFVGKLGVGFPITAFGDSVKNPEFQVNYMLGRNGQLSGLFFGLEVGF